MRMEKVRALRVRSSRPPCTGRIQWVLLALVFLLTMIPIHLSSASAEESGGEGYGQVDSYEVILGTLAELLEDTGQEELSKDVQTINKVVSSEEFQSLMSYPQMQELLKVVLEKGTEFALSEKELTGKILETVGVDESLVSLLELGLEIWDNNRDAVQGFLESGDWKIILESMPEGLDKEEQKVLGDSLASILSSMDPEANSPVNGQ